MMEERWGSGRMVQVFCECICVRTRARVCLCVWVFDPGMIKSKGEAGNDARL